MRHEIILDNLKACINSQGGILEYLTDKGRNIIFPKKEIVDNHGNIKIRGGIFSCIPNFGIDEINSLEQHGYGRNVEWDILKKGEEFIVLKCVGVRNYKKLITYLTYELKKDGIIMRLELLNTGSSELLIAPGFHPYFQSEKNYLKVEGLDYSKVELENSVFLERNTLEFETKYHKYYYRSKDFNTYIIWSDFKDDYICIEPTYNGTSFKKDYKYRPYKLKNRETYKMEVLLSWKEN